MTAPMTFTPRVTVGLPTYNRAIHLRSAIKLILAQDFQDFELLISDDASPDATQDVVSDCRDERIRYSRNSSNLKIPGNLNQILRKARGEYIVMLHDHDSFHPSLLSRMVRVLDADSAVGLVFSGLAWTDHLGNGYRELIDDLPERMSGLSLVRSMLKNTHFSCPVNACGMVRRSAYEAAGSSFDDRFGFLSDVDMWFRIGLKCDVGYLREPLIVCKAREPGHEFGALSWPLVRWTVEIQRTNLERYCTVQPAERAELGAALQSKTNALLAISLLRALAGGNRAQWEEGMRCVRDFGTGLLRYLVRLLTLVRAAGPLLAIGPRARDLWHRWRSMSRTG